MGVCYICKSRIPDSVTSCPVCGAIQHHSQPSQPSQPQQYGGPQPGQPQPSQPQQYGGPQPSQPQPSRPQQYGGPQPSQPQPSQPQQYGGPQPGQPQQYGGSQPSQPQQYGGPQPSQPQQYGGAQPNQPQQYGGPHPGQPQPSQPQQYGGPQPSQPQQYGGAQPNQPQQYGGAQPGQPQQYGGNPQPVQQTPNAQQGFVQAGYSGNQPPSSGGASSGADEYKKPVNKGLIIGLIAGAAVIIAAVLLIFVFDVFGLKGGKPEKTAEAFINAYTEMDAQKLIDTLAPEVKSHLEEVGLGSNIEEIQESFDMLKGFGVKFEDIKIGDAESLDVEKVKKDVKENMNIDIEAKDAAKVKCSFNMHMEFMGETMDESTELVLTLVKQGSKWYVVDMTETGNEGGTDDPIDIGGEGPTIGGEDPGNGGSDSNSEEEAKKAAQKFTDGYVDLDVDAMLESMAPELRNDTSSVMGESKEEMQASFDELKEYGVEFVDGKAGEVEKTDAEEVKNNIKNTYGIDAVVDDAAKVKCSITMHMDYEGESFDEPMEYYLTVIKQGDTWYVADFNEVETDEPETPDDPDVTDGKPEGSTEITGGLDNPPTDEVPGFEKYGIKTDMKLNETYTFETSTSDDPSITGTASVSVIEYTDEELTDDVIQFGEENDMDLTGYMKKYVHFSISFDDQVFTDYGFNYSLWVDDYYSTELVDSTYDTRTDSYGEDYGIFNVMVNGEEKPIYYWIEWNHSSEEHWYSRPEVMILCPKGYKGLVAGISKNDGSKSANAIFVDYDPENFHLFRLD